MLSIIHHASPVKSGFEHKAPVVRTHRAYDMCLMSLNQTGKAVVFFTVRSTSSEFVRATLGKRISTSA